MRSSSFHAAVIGVLFCFLFSESAGTVSWYVDASVTESGDGKSWQTAFKTIQQGTNASSEGDTVVVAEGTYVENVKFNGRNIILTGTDPSNSEVVASTVIDGSRNGPAVAFAGTEDETCVLSGFTITNGRPGILGGPWGHPGGCATILKNVIRDGFREHGGGLCRCDGTIQNNVITGNHAGICGAGLYDCDGIIMNNRITGNESSEDGGGLGECDGIIQNNLIAGNTAWESGEALCECHAIVLNCAIVDNSTGSGGGLFGCHGLILNCIIWANTADGSGDQLHESNAPSFSCIQNWSGGGEGNISEDPLFVDAGGGDYRLKANSPCVNAGLNFYWFAWPQRDLDGNCRLFGGRVDMGGYEYGSSPDSDGDLLPDAEENSLAPLPSDANDDDCDGDGLRDGLEVLRGSDAMSPTPPRVVNVPSDISTVQQALCLALQGDTINVEPGTYRENIHFCGTDVVLRNFQYGNPNWWWWLRDVLLDGGSAGPAVSFEGSESPACVLAGFTIRNGKAHTGGGIRGGRRGKHTHATICDNEVTSNSAVGYQSRGGGIALCDGVIRGNMVTANSGGEAGGGLAFCHGLIENNRICANSATGEYADGGGLYDCEGTIRNNDISENSANTGGGLYDCDGTIQDNAITGNSAKQTGGGLYDCDGPIQNNTIADNSARSAGGLYDCDGTIENNLIVENSASRGIRGVAGGLYYCKGTIQNDTIAGNSAGYAGGGVYGCVAVIRNCIIWGNVASIRPQLCDCSEPTYSCIQGWEGDGPGNISEEPLFLDAAGGNYHLKAGSPCIDAGVDYYWFVWPLRDLDGNCRLFGKRVDIGCYECAASPDSDGDLLSDQDESAAGTDPDTDDTDSDGLRDGLEFLRGTDPLRRTEPGVLSVPLNAATVQRAVCLAVSGDEIVVAAGTYRENVQLCGCDVVLRSCDPSDLDIVASTILDGNWNGPVLSFLGTESERCVVDGLTIRNGRAFWGGGICGATMNGRTRAAIRNNLIRDNRADRGGGLAFCDGAVENNSISSNQAAEAGGLYDCDGTMRRNTVTQNSAGGDGGGLYGCDGVIHDNTIIHNTCATGNSGGLGGGLAYCSAEIRGNVISRNSSGDDGGGLAWCYGTIEHNTISRNATRWHGGGLWDCSGAIQNNLIVGNCAGARGGGLYECRTIRNNTIVGNSASEGGGMYYCYAGEIRNCIIWGNSATEGAQMCFSAYPAYSCVQDWATGGEGNTAENPTFVDGSNGNFRLAPDSPCIDAGFNHPQLPETDIAGMHRIMFGGKSLTVDMGAYEYYINELKLGPFAEQTTLTWSSLADESYSILFSDDLLSWHPADDRVLSEGNETTSWIDDGSKTGIAPLLAPRRFYRILENP